VSLLDLLEALIENGNVVQILLAGVKDSTLHTSANRAVSEVVTPFSEL
jgi:hypothetical protein